MGRQYLIILCSYIIVEYYKYNKYNAEKKEKRKKQDRFMKK
jgi:hypothetical protein